MCLLRNSTTKADLSDNPLSCECSSSDIVNEALGDNVTLNCATQYLKAKLYLSLADSCLSVSSISETVGVVINDVEADLNDDDVTLRTEINTISETSVL
jgi:hypothetical protein